MSLLRLTLRGNVPIHFPGAAPPATSRRMLRLRSGVFLILMLATEWAFGGSQQETWKGGDGNWTDASNWSGNVIPKNGSPRTDSSYAVTIDSTAPSSVILTLPNVSIDDLAVNAGNTLALASQAQLRVLGVTDAGVFNAGTINLNAASGLTMGGADGILSGGGTINLLGTSAMLSREGAWINQDQLIQGAGTIANMQINRSVIAATGALSVSDEVNTGTIQARIGGTATLSAYVSPSLQNFEGTHQGLIEADDGGTIQINAPIIGGQIQVVGNGKVTFASTAGFTGGTLVNSGQGTIQILGAAVSGTIVNPAGGQISSTLAMTFGPDSEIQNAGTISARTIRIGGLVTLNGGGEVLLNNTDIYSGENPTGRLVNEDNLIHGNGIINLPITNLGVIDADVKNAVLTLAEPGTSNNGVLRATNGGKLMLPNGLAGSGQLQADGGIISITSTTAANASGPISVTAGGQLHLLPSSKFGGSNLNVDATGTLNVEANAGLSLSGNFSFAGSDKTRWLWAGTGSQITNSASLTMAGGVGASPGAWNHWATLEVGGRDFGLDPLTQKPVATGFMNNFNLPDLHIGRGAHVLLTDLIDNGDRGGPGGAPEALYVNRLLFDDNTGTLDLNGLHLYSRFMLGSPQQIIDQAVPEPGALAMILFAGCAFCRRRKT